MQKIPNTAKSMLNRVRRKFAKILRIEPEHISAISNGELANNYATTIQSGTIKLIPRNLCVSIEIMATSHIARRILTTGVYEPEVSSLLTELLSKNNVAVNVGANVGIWTLFMTERFRNLEHVYAVEPHPVAFHFLEKNVAEQVSKGRVTLLNCGCSENSDSLDFSFSNEIPEYSSIGNVAHPSAKQYRMEKMKIPVKPLDDLLRDETREIGLLLIDVEGHELQVLKGSKKIIEKWKPNILFEVEKELLSSESSELIEIEDFLQGLGYRFYTCDGESVKALNSVRGTILARPQ